MHCYKSSRIAYSYKNDEIDAKMEKDSQIVNNSELILSNLTISIENANDQQLTEIWDHGLTAIENSLNVEIIRCIDINIYIAFQTQMLKHQNYLSKDQQKKLSQIRRNYYDKYDKYREYLNETKNNNN